MEALDQTVAGLGGGGGLLVAVLLGFLVGMRHATDPDHLTAVSMLVMSSRDGVRSARRLGLFWGLGHGTTLLLLGMPVVLVADWLPEPVQQGAEVLIAVVIAALAIRLLVRWRRGYFHAHPHRHGNVIHSHPHAHEPDAGHSHAHADGDVHEHDHEHQESLGRSPAAAYGIGLVHGVGGSAGVGLLLIGAIPDTSGAALALVVFAAATALSMALMSTALATTLSRRALAARFETIAPVLGSLSLAFGVWYGLAAFSVLPAPAL